MTFSDAAPLAASRGLGLPKSRRTVSLCVTLTVRRCDENGLAMFDLIRRHGALASAVHCAFDLLELDGRDLRREPIEKRKALLAKLLRGSNLSVVLN
jgi:hypothetical protein